LVAPPFFKSNILEDKMSLPAIGKFTDIPAYVTQLEEFLPGDMVLVKELETGEFPFPPRKILGLVRWDKEGWRSRYYARLARSSWDTSGSLINVIYLKLDSRPE
jgi:hypothetical protein